MKTPSSIRRELLRGFVLMLQPLLISTSLLTGAEGPDPLSAWRTGVELKEIGGKRDRHVIHTYYLANPESPDGSHLLFFVSDAPDAHRGELVVMNRQTGMERVIATGIDTEDAHRAACQQWISGGKRVAYHDVKHGVWSIHIVDLDTGENRRVAQNRQLGFGRAVDDVLPLYGCHWNPGPHRDLELLDARTGEIRTVVTIADVEGRYGSWLTKEFGGGPTSIFFPVISPDGTRVFFKMAAQGADGAANNFRSRNASRRQGTVVYNLETGEPVFMREGWGHPAWHPDSRKIFESRNNFYDTADGGRMTEMPSLPTMPGNHPSVSPDGKLFVMDGPAPGNSGPATAWGMGEWAVVVCDVRGHGHHALMKFDNSKGATSWRRNHPHPVFSADGKRVYFNVNEGPWTRLLVAEASPAP